MDITTVSADSIIHYDQDEDVLLLPTGQREDQSVYSNNQKHLLRDRHTALRTLGETTRLTTVYT